MKQDKGSVEVFSMDKRIKSFYFAFQGLKLLLFAEHNTRIHLSVALAVVIAGFIFEVTALEWCILMFAIGSVMITEAFNTAIEYFVDLISPEYNPLAGKIKDMAAAAVLVAATIAAIVGLIIFWPKVF